MYLVPEDTWLLPLIGQRLIEICCTINQAIFHFSNQASIVALSDFTLIGDRCDLEIALPVSDAIVFGLLECTVRAIKASDDRMGVLIEFDNDQSLSLMSDPNYESLHFSIRGDERIV